MLETFLVGSPWIWILEMVLGEKKGHHFSVHNDKEI